jgi:hypothetical protein
MNRIEDELCFRVDQWTDDGSRIDSVLSLSMNALIAQGAFYEAVKLRPHKRLTMRHKSRVINEHVPERLRLIDIEKRAELERMIAEAKNARKK